jgi:hypothetical protein
MNYLEIVLHGYYNQNDRNHLEKYFQRECLKAEKENFIDSEVFFSGCLNEILIFKNDIQKQISKKKLQLIQYSSQDGEINNDFVKRLKEQIEYQEINGITNIRLGDGTILHLKINEINFIETAIKGAYQKSLKPTTTKETPFIDDKTKELIEYLVKNWRYNKQQKYADIYTTLDGLGEYKMPFKSDYQDYIIKQFGHTGKFQYDKVKSTQNQNKKELLELIKNFSKK